MTSFFSAEYLLTSGKLPNGGSAVFYRSAIVTIEIMLIAYLAWLSLDPEKQWSTYSMNMLQKDIISLTKWTAGVFGGVYIAFYARFVSQWTYLANLYNQIKQTEVQGVKNEKALSQWKAGFIEDALDLHMATKPGTLAIIRAWGFGHESAPVYQAFIAHAHDGRRRWDDLVSKMVNSK